MGKAKLVTLSQFWQVCKKARAKGITSRQLQGGVSDGSFDCFLESLKIEVNKSIKPPINGARIYMLHALRVRQDSEWQATISAGAPNTPRDCDVWKIGHLYRAVGSGIITENLIFLNFPDGNGSWNKALAWAETQSFKQTNPREVFAIGKEYPTLHIHLGQNPVHVVATSGCILGTQPWPLHTACSVWWQGSKREANVLWIGVLNNANAWFLFRK